MSDLVLIVVLGVAAVVLFELTVGLRSRAQLASIAEALARNPTVLDVRTGLEFRVGHLPGAVHLPLSRLPFRARREVVRERPVIVYCASGTRSMVAAFLLRRLGFPEVLDLGPLRNAGKLPRPDEEAQGRDRPDGS